MNLHPIVIHFPIALLTLYSVLELVRVKKVLDQPYWFYVKAVLVMTGSLGTILGVATGVMLVGSITAEGPKIFMLHKYFGLGTLLLSVVSAGAYVFGWFRPNRFSNFILRPRVVVTLAFLILVFVTITGGLGGGMTRGTNFDPLMAPIFKLLGIY
jgi:uncharacterized membrane protein